MTKTKAATATRTKATTATLGRVVLGGYLAVHGAQKLFGSFGGHGLEATSAGFESMGLTPGKQMATLAGASELAGGVLTATGIAEPLGPVAIAGAMAVATAVHRKAGPLSANGGYELALTNLALAAALAGSGHGFHLGPRLPKRLATVTVLGAAGLSAVALAKVLTATPPAPAPAPADEVADPIEAEIDVSEGPSTVDQPEVVTAS